MQHITMMAYELHEMHTQMLMVSQTNVTVVSPPPRESDRETSLLSLSSRSKTELSPETYEVHEAFYTAMYHVTPDGDLLVSPAGLKALSDMVKGYRWVKRGTHYSFERYTSANCYSAHTAGRSGHKTLSILDDQFSIREAEDDETAMTETTDVITRFMKKVYSTLFVGCAIEAPLDFVGRERSKVGNVCYFVTLDPLQKFGRTLAKFGAGVRPEVLVELLHSFEDGIVEGLAMIPKPTLSWLFYDKTPQFGFALCGASSRSIGPSHSLANKAPASDVAALQRQVATLQREAAGGERRKAKKAKPDTSNQKVAGDKDKKDTTGKGKFYRKQGGEPLNPYKCDSTVAGHGKHSYCHMNHSSLV